ncbi:carboxypeptidase-like protein [Mariniflexile fucanivorans]|uniref:Carboxypeptidase-like protein n=1 Tax=Mariniflexile fucanivorans TaxID=264023 RepID=A0A4R1RCE3_9FLAO|nr:carboxypeptidase-like regulatory domain-containing protein [Mariniflexile fucanivorans]TCL63505.1 carboxypeptidase-like protein [Mariniflexile fucanivorans]
MKHLIYIVLFLFSAFSFGQNTGIIVGKVLDSELNNAPLVLANVSIKGTSIDLNTDLSGFFIIENLEPGDYTLVCGFAGYETQEIKVHVDALQPAEVKLSLTASTISFGDLASLTSVAQNDNTTFIAAK